MGYDQAISLELQYEQQKTDLGLKLLIFLQSIIQRGLIILPNQTDKSPSKSQFPILYIKYVLLLILCPVTTYIYHERAGP